MSVRRHSVNKAGIRNKALSCLHVNRKKEKKRNMITVIIGTNRGNSNTSKVAHKYLEYLQEKEVACQLLDLAELPGDFISSSMYENRSEYIQKLQTEVLFPTEKYVIVVPEYNGTFPGIFKLLIDACEIKQAFYGKKVSLTGVSSGRAGCLRGLDSLTNALNYIKMEVLINKLPISQIGGLLDEEGNFNHEATLELMHKQMDELVAF